MPFEKVVVWQHPIPVFHMETKLQNILKCRLGKNPGEHMIIIALSVCHAEKSWDPKRRQEKLRNSFHCILRRASFGRIPVFLLSHIDIPPLLSPLQLYADDGPFSKKFVSPTVLRRKPATLKHEKISLHTKHSLVLQQRWARHHNSNLVSHMKKLS